ncbi:hypothetical protein SAMN05444007_103384 [Cribrihabitans marinus]|uniref:Uncharacterized protein n=1 Tax=Cribrihabitans marinus TaxID=1227549 RepID=A0A1H6WJY6_9RHOB|nr:hypothetical protein [Cribrihabitans marinus]GGH24525.1 hypothetical protein GCM10010973_11080 [Cribrihabitans marinus]SEJ12782.1 hypothetical protein SAMN05444007_103384 [Cribrihabitans marinus]
MKNDIAIGQMQGLRWASNEARRIASLYPPSSDGQNTFALHADACDREAERVTADLIEWEGGEV